MQLDQLVVKMAMHIDATLFFLKFYSTVDEVLIIILIHLKRVVHKQVLVLYVVFVVFFLLFLLLLVQL